MLFKNKTSICFINAIELIRLFPIRSSAVNTTLLFSCVIDCIKHKKKYI